MTQRLWWTLSAALPLGTFAAWQARVFMASRDPPRLKRTPMGTVFFPGSVDDQIMDSLETGDVVLFERQWEGLRPIGALLCALRKQAYPSRFDHVAVVVVSPKDYTPMVLEAAHSRIKLRRYDERIASSRATRIHVRKLQCARSHEARRAAWELAASLDGQPVPVTLRQILGLNPSLRKHLLPQREDGEPRQQGVAHALHPAATLVGLVWAAMGVTRPEAHLDMLTVEDMGPKASVWVLDRAARVGDEVLVRA